MRATLRLLLLTMCMGFTLATSGCGDAVDTGDDVTKTVGNQLSSDPNFGYRVQFLGMRYVFPSVRFYNVNGSFGFPVVPQQGDPYAVPGWSYRMMLLGGAMNCQLYFNWSAVGSYPVNPPPAYIPYTASSGATHFVSGGPSQCTFNGSAAVTIPAGAIEFWPTSNQPAVGQAAGYLRFRYGNEGGISGWSSPQTTAVIRTN